MTGAERIAEERKRQIVDGNEVTKYWFGETPTAPIKENWDLPFGERRPQRIEEVDTSGPSEDIYSPKPPFEKPEPEIPEKVEEILRQKAVWLGRDGQVEELLKVLRETYKMGRKDEEER